jgi:hypothetical protein
MLKIEELALLLDKVPHIPVEEHPTASTLRVPPRPTQADKLRIEVHQASGFLREIVLHMQQLEARVATLESRLTG